MSRIRHIRCLAVVLAGLAGALLTFAAAAPAAVAWQLRPDPPWWLRHWALPVQLPPGPLGLFKHRRRRQGRSPGRYRCIRSPPTPP
jgi:hypothetical protein